VASTWMIQSRRKKKMSVLGWESVLTAEAIYPLPLPKSQKLSSYST
jgi:hypothetical protein